MGLNWAVNNKMDTGNCRFRPGLRIPDRLWAIILAGGNGNRIQNLTNRWKGRHVPKQYCAFVGSRSMLQHTIDRVDVLVKPKRQRILIAAEHQLEAQSQLAGYWPERVIVQPENRDTLPGILLPMTYIYRQDKKASVVVYPTDHFIYPKWRFSKVVAEAAMALETLPEMLMLIGVPADSPEREYGWIYPGSEIWRSGEYTAYTVKRFLEKPLQADAAHAMRCGGLWNRFILVVKADTLWRLGWIYFPETMSLFEHLLNSIGSRRERNVLEAIYEEMPSSNFSSVLLTRAVDRIGVLPMKGVLWSDWGSEKRIVETLVKIGKQPNFPCTLPVISEEGTRGRIYGDRACLQIHQ